jgi:hypothetical protein
MHVKVDVEVGVVLPVRRTADARLDRDLAKARKDLDDPFLEYRAQAPPVDRLVEPEHRVDDHQVRRRIHTQPRCVCARHRLLGGHRHSLTSANCLGIGFGADRRPY